MPDIGSLGAALQTAMEARLQNRTFAELEKQANTLPEAQREHFRMLWRSVKLREAVWYLDQQLAEMKLAKQDDLARALAHGAVFDQVPQDQPYAPGLWRILDQPLGSPLRYAYFLDQRTAAHAYCLQHKPGLVL